MRRLGLFLLLPPLFLTALALDLLGRPGAAASDTPDDELLSLSPLLGTAVPRAEPDGPLARFLDSLTIQIDEIEQRIGIVTFKAYAIVCTHLAVDRVITNVDLPPQGQSRITLDVTGLNIDCSGKWTAAALGGDFVVAVKPGAEANVQLGTPINDDGVPYQANVVSCNPTLDLSVTLSGSIFSWLLNAVISLLQSTIRTQIQDKLCNGLKDLAQNNLTALIQMFDEGMKPAGSASHVGRALAEDPSSSEMRDRGQGGSVDWTKVDLIKTIDWVLEDVLTAKDIDKLFEWALNNSGTIELAGPDGPLVSLGGPSLRFDVGLKNLTIVGVDGINSYQPITAVSASDLYAKLALGTVNRTSMSVSGSFIVNMSSGDDSQPGKSSKAIEPMQISIGLTEPAMEGTMKVLLSQDELMSKKTVAQWLFGAPGCIQDSLMESPHFELLNASIAGVSAPLQFTSETTGRLEGDLAAFANNMVHWFNAYYLKYLPNFITRTFSSIAFINKVNALLADAIKPTPAGQKRCMSQRDADAKVDQDFAQFVDWNRLLGGPIRESIDRIADNYFAMKNTSHIGAVSKLHPLDLKTSEVEVEVAARSFDLAGMSAVKKLRVLLPEANDSTLLTNIVNISCQEYRASLLGKFDVSAKSRSVLWHSESDYSLPCGEFELGMHAKLDVHRALKQQLPLTPVCMLASMQELSIKSAHGALEQLYDLLIKLRDDRPAENPIKELCEDYPKLCTRLANLGVGAGSVPKLNHLLSSLLVAAHVACTTGGWALASPLTPLRGISDLNLREAANDAEGGVQQNAAALIIVSIVVSGGLAAALLYRIAGSAAALAAAGRGCDGRGASLAVRCWASGRRRDRTQTVVLTSALALALVLRTVCLFFLNVADAVAIVGLDGIGRVLDVHLITFTFPSMVSHYWDASAYLSALLLLVMSGLVAYGVIVVTLAVWLVPMTTLKTKFWLRLAIALARFPFVDAVFFGHLIPILNRTSMFPLGLGVTIQNSASSGIYVGVVSAVLCIVAANCIHGHLPAAAAPEQAFGRSRLVSMVLAAVACLGLVLFLAVGYFRIEFSELTGDLFPTSSFSGLALIHSTLSSDAVLGLILIIMLILAPLLQISAAFLPDAVLPKGKPILRKVGDAVVLYDVFFGGLIAILLDVDGIAKWIVDDRFHAECTMATNLLGAGCIGLRALPLAAGFMGLILAVIGTFGLSLATAFEELRSEARRPLLEEPACGHGVGAMPAADPLAMGERAGHVA